MDEQNKEGNERKIQDALCRRRVERERGREGRKKEAEDLAVDDNWEHCRLTIWWSTCSPTVEVVTILFCWTTILFFPATRWTISRVNKGFIVVRW